MVWLGFELRLTGIGVHILSHYHFLPLCSGGVVLRHWVHTTLQNHTGSSHEHETAEDYILKWQRAWGEATQLLMNNLEVFAFISYIHLFINLVTSHIITTIKAEHFQSTSLI